MKWPKQIEASCPNCGAISQFPISVFLSLQAVCLSCGGSLASAGRDRLKKHAEFCRSIKLLKLAMELIEVEQIPLLDCDLDSFESLEDLIRIVASRLATAPDCWKHAEALVMEVANRIIPDYLHDPEYDNRIIQSQIDWWTKQLENPRSPYAIEPKN